MTLIVNLTYLWFIILALLIIVVITNKLEKKQGFENLSPGQIGGISIGTIIGVLVIMGIVYAGLKYQTGQILRKYGL